MSEIEGELVDSVQIDHIDNPFGEELWNYPLESALDVSTTFIVIALDMEVVVDGMAPKQ